MLARSNHPQKQAMRLVFKGGSGGGVGKEKPPSKASRVCSFSRVEVVKVLARSNHPQKQAMRLVFEGGSGGGVGIQSPKTSATARFRGRGGGCWWWLLSGRCCWPKEGSIPENECNGSFSGRGVGLGGGGCQGGVVMVARGRSKPQKRAQWLVFRVVRGGDS